MGIEQKTLADIRLNFELAIRHANKVCAYLECNAIQIQRSAELIEEARALMAQVDTMLPKKVDDAPRP